MTGCLRARPDNELSLKIRYVLYQRADICRVFLKKNTTCGLNCLLRSAEKQSGPCQAFVMCFIGSLTHLTDLQGNAFGGLNFGDTNFHMSFGIGAFPLGFFASTLNFGGERLNPHVGEYVFV